MKPPLTKVLRLYHQMLSTYGEPGHWPWFEAGKKRPHTPEEIIIGAVLAQNTNWRNVEYALCNLQHANITTLKKILALGKKNPNTLSTLIRPSGFFHQKTERLLCFATYLITCYGGLERFAKHPIQKLRAELLGLPGIGSETADTILLYATRKPIFVIDAYTRRFAKHFHLTKREKYDDLQHYFMHRLPRNTRLYQNYHALIVRWGKDQLR